MFTELSIRVSKCTAARCSACSSISMQHVKLSPHKHRAEQRCLQGVSSVYYDGNNAGLGRGYNELSNPGTHCPEEGFKLVYYVGKWLVDWIWILVVLMERCNKLQVIHEAAAQRRRSNNGCLLRLCATAFDSGDWWRMCQTLAWDWSLWRWTEKEEKSPTTPALLLTSGYSVKYLFRRSQVG